MRYKDLYCDKDGFPNEKAFLQFGMSINKEDNYRLICMNIDLQKANSIEGKGYGYGNHLMRKLYINMKEHGGYPFRIQGGKFNILVPNEKTAELSTLLSKENEDYTVYYGLVDEPYEWSKTTDLVDKGKSLMYHDRDTKLQNQLSVKRQNPESTLSSDTPQELRETPTFKYLKTMWYAHAKIVMSTPSYREANLSVFATARVNPLQNFPILVVLEEVGTNPRIMWIEGRAEIGLGGATITVNMRLNKDESAALMLFVENGEAEFKNKIVHNGVCLPANFGKRIGNGYEIYPVRPNAFGTFSYVKMNTETHETEWVENGIVSMDGVDYEVTVDNESITLNQR